MQCHRCCHYHETLKQYGERKLCEKCIRQIERGSGTYTIVKDDEIHYEGNSELEETDLNNLTR